MELPAFLKRPSWPGDLILVILLAAIACYFGSNAFSPVRFDREKIEIRAMDRQIQVTGLYHYRNRVALPASISLGLPFPVDAAHPAPSTFSIAEVDADGANPRAIAARDYHGNVVFRLWFAPHQEKWIRVDYVQGALQPTGRYLLLTTRQWKRPLDYGEYILHVAGGAELATSNYALALESRSRERQYSFARTDFLPTEDWQFSWTTPATQVRQEALSR